MLGAVIGDIVGSRFEWNNLKSKDFELFDPKCTFTDDTVMTAAIADAFLSCEEDQDIEDVVIRKMRIYGRRFPTAGYGSAFREWINSDKPKPYNSWGNGAAMRVSPCAWVASSLEETISLARLVTQPTHNHREGIKGAEATAVAIFLARQGTSKEYIRQHISSHYYPLDFSLASIRPAYSFHVSCQNSVPQALMAFFEATSFEDAIRNAVSIGGDSDTLAAIAGSVAEASFGIPKPIRESALSFLPEELKKPLLLSERVFSTPLIL